MEKKDKKNKKERKKFKKEKKKLKKQKKMIKKEKKISFSLSPPFPPTTPSPPAGGETIREIENISGAHIVLSRAPPPNSFERFFIIRGTWEQIDNAQRMISEKIGLATSPIQGG